MPGIFVMHAVMPRHLWREAKVGKFVKQAEVSASFAKACQAAAQISPPCTAWSGQVPGTARNASLAAQKTSLCCP
jgi:hypothetical protein